MFFFLRAKYILETVRWLSGKQYTSQNDPFPPHAARPFKGDVHSLPVSNVCGRIFHCEAGQKPANSPGALCKTRSVSKPGKAHTEAGEMGKLEWQCLPSISQIHFS